jgi:hypothetical protein
MELHKPVNALGLAASVRLSARGMLGQVITRVVEFCTRHPLPVIGLGLLLTVASAIYTARLSALTLREGIAPSQHGCHRRDSGHSLPGGVTPPHPTSADSLSPAEAGPLLTSPRKSGP